MSAARDAGAPDAAVPGVVAPDGAPDAAVPDAVAPVLGRYRELLALSELELELAGRGEVDALDGLGARWQQLMASLPAVPPAQAGPIISAARLVHERTRLELLRVRDGLVEEAARAGRAQRTARGYGGELQARVRVETSA